MGSQIYFFNTAHSQIMPIPDRNITNQNKVRIDVTASHIVQGIKASIHVNAMNYRPVGTASP